MLGICPCKDCTKRWLKIVDGAERTCHSVCKSYISWKKELDKVNEELRKKKAYDL